MRIGPALISIALGIAACTPSSKAPPALEAGDTSEASGPLLDAEASSDGWADASSVDAGDASDAEGPHLSIVGLESAAIHEHGGAAAVLRAARFRVANTGKTAVLVRVRHVAFLSGRSCTEIPTVVRSEPKFLGIVTPPSYDARPTLEVAPGATREIQVTFDGVEAYYTYCDRFFFRVTFDLGSEVRNVLAETKVSRIDPPHRP